MAEFDLSLVKHVHVNKNGDGDRFVGIKAESNEAMVYFPIGYRIPESEDAIRQDILRLITVLSEFTERKDRVLHMQKFEAPQSVDFPVNAYMEIINYYLQNGYYVEKEVKHVVATRGAVDWNRTIKTIKPMAQSDGSFIYLNMQVRKNSPNDTNLITQIHKYCVYESFVKMGWLFTPFLPQKPTIERNVKVFLQELNYKNNHTNNDVEKRLFGAMIAMLRYEDEATNDKRFYFGTDTFEHVWEKLLDRMFGVKDKQKYFPRTYWHLKGTRSANAALEPDTIMIWGGKLYVLDAKYYRYGISGNPSQLPESTSINKQITYGEYIYTNEEYHSLYGENVFNAFLMPFDASKNPFDTTEEFYSIGEATGNWRTAGHNFERVQGIVIDINYVMHHYTGRHDREIAQLAALIEQSLAEHGGALPN